MASTRPGHQKVSANIPKPLYEKMVDYRYSSGVSLSGIICIAVAEYLERQEAQVKGQQRFK